MRRKNLKKIRIEERVETPSRYFYFFITISPSVSRRGHTGLRSRRLLGLLVKRLVDRYLTICSTTLDARPIARYSIHSRERGHHGRREEPREGTDAEATSGERRGDGFRGSIRTVPENGEVTIRRA